MFFPDFQIALQGVMTANQDLTATMMQPGSIPIPHPTTLQVIGLAWPGRARLGRQNIVTALLINIFKIKIS